MSENRQNFPGRIRQHQGHLQYTSLALIGILVFAAFVHHKQVLFFLAIGGLTWSALMIALSIRNMPILKAFGIDRLSRKILIYCLPALVLGLLMGIFTRNSANLALFPARITRVAIIAPLVGAVEELIFRGYFQGDLRPIGRGFSIISTSVGHSAYKMLVILSLPLPLQFDIFFLIIWTFIGGVLFGLLREQSGSTIPPILAHALFDIILYGDLVTSPVWVWT